VQDGVLGGGVGRIDFTKRVANAGAIEVDGAGIDFLAGFEQDSGSTLITYGPHTITVSGGNFLLLGGTVEGDEGSTISVTGQYQQSGGTTTAYSANITVTDQILLSGGSMLFQDSTLTAPNGMQIASGALLQGGGSINVGSSTLTNAGTINPGTIASADAMGHIGVSGNYTQTSSGILNMDVGGSGSTNVWDTLDVSALATLAGTLNVLTPGSIPIAGSFEVVTWGSHTIGNYFTTVNLPPTGHWGDSYDDTTPPYGFVAIKFYR